MFQWFQATKQFNTTRLRHGHIEARGHGLTETRCNGVACSMAFLFGSVTTRNQLYLIPLNIHRYPV